ncbi:site-specific integrase [Hydrogenophaga sp. IBVHS2]|uniref:tyrosine-type recombinase/integrase n=1 Tax=Hydrogenophaga sp. IBVHS2 TaxID=1985170 RepID=UPI0015C50A83|nr:site-specific integrase [Hydrogenophaga sp. IBVHS2]
MSCKVCYSDPNITTKLGFGKVAHLPFILDNRPGYHRLGSRYLIDRGLGIWNPETRGKGPRATRPAKKTIKNYAHWLANFLEWAEVYGIDLKTCEYAEHVQGRYQNEMIKGLWSADGRGLKPATVNPRVQQACDFLTWMSDKGEREPFDVPTEKVKVRVGSATSPIGHRAKEVTRRVGKVRQNKRRLRMPTRLELITWLSSVNARHGELMGLICETILLTGLRIEEASALRIDTLPDDPRRWRIPNVDAPKSEQQVLVDIRYGAKGPDYGEDHGDKIGPERTILVPRNLADKLHAYRLRQRNPALRKWVSAAADARERKERISGAVHLFLHPRTGKRITADNIYRAWKKADLPFDGWSPHLGRDWWACSTLLQEIERHERLKELGPAVATQLLESVGMTVIRMRIQPQLGHKSETTSLIYLQWVSDRLGTPLSIEYDAAFEAAEDNGGVSDEHPQRS